MQRRSKTNDFILQVTSTVYVHQTPTALDWQYWAFPLLWNFTFALLFVALAAKLHVGNSFLYGMLFVSGGFFGGLLGDMAKMTPWYDPVFWFLLIVVVLVVRGLRL